MGMANLLERENAGQFTKLAKTIGDSDRCKCELHGFCLPRCELHCPQNELKSEVLLRVRRICR